MKERWKVMSDGGLGIGWKCIGVFDDYVSASIALDNLISDSKGTNIQYKITKGGKNNDRRNFSNRNKS